MFGTLLLLGAAHVHLSDHLRVADEEGWRITACHDRDADRRARMAEELGARELTALPEAAEWDAAIVCSETVHHEEDISHALSLGLPVFTEKPLAGDAEAALRLAQKAEAAGLPLVTNYFMRTYGAVRALHEAVAGGRLGQVTEARFRFAHDGGYADWLDLTGWMTDPALACYGGFADEGVHVLDIALWMFGPLAPVAAAPANALGFAVDDHGVALLRTRDGAPVTVSAGWTDAEMRLEIDIVGSAGHARLDGGRLTITGRDGSSEGHDLDELDSGAGLRPFLHDRTGVPPRDAAAVNAVLDALYRR